MSFRFLQEPLLSPEERELPPLTRKEIEKEIESSFRTYFVQKKYWNSVVADTRERELPILALKNDLLHLFRDLNTVSESEFRSICKKTLQAYNSGSNLEEKAIIDNLDLATYVPPIFGI